MQTVQLFITCMGENLLPDVLKKMVRLLERLGLRCEFPESQTCCGQPMANSGYQFFEHVCIENGLKCESMNGKSNVFHYLNKHKGEKILVIADGAAFGSEIDRVLQVIHGRKNVALYLPESFEWMIMDADILKNNTVRSILSNPSEYVESKLYFSWERFFTAILIEQTKDTYLAYAKRKLNPAYLSGAIKESILRKMNIIDLDKKDE